MFAEGMKKINLDHYKYWINDGYVGVKMAIMKVQISHLLLLLYIFMKGAQFYKMGSKYVILLIFELIV